MNKLKALLERFRSNPDPIQAQIDELITHITEKSEREIYTTVLRNQFNYIYSQPSQKCPHCKKEISANTNELNKLLPKLAVKVLDELMILREFVGFQPMSGPVGLIYKLRYKELEENEDGSKRITLEVTSNAIEATSRKLHARFTIEATQDLKAQHGVDMEDEILQALASETAHEIICEILHDLQKKVKKVEYKSGHELNLHIMKAANKIARKTRRGAGNFVILNPMSLVLLQCQDGSQYKAMTDEEKTKYSSKSFLTYCGTLNKTMKVFMDPFQEVDAIVGYNGSTSTDCGIIYSPYVLVMSTGVIMDPETFSPVIGFLTRYGKSIDDNSKSYYIALKQKGDPVSLVDQIKEKHKLPEKKEATQEIES